MNGAYTMFRWLWNHLLMEDAMKDFCEKMHVSMSSLFPTKMTILLDGIQGTLSTGKSIIPQITSHKKDFEQVMFFSASLALFPMDVTV